VLNPLRSEQEAFRFLVYVIVVVAVVVGVVLLLRAVL
jgi:predicted nucleic acid-binding Zn ribbon protein